MFTPACRYVAFLLVLIVVVSSCSKKVPEQTKYIPKDASAVFSINPKEFVDKLNDNGVNVDSIVKAALAGDDQLQWTMEDLQHSGISLDKELYLFVQQGGSIMTGETSSMGVVGALGSASDFEALLKKKMPGVQFQKGDGFTYATLQDGFVAGWNKEVALLVNASSNNGQEDETGSADFSASQKALGLYFNQDKDASIASVDAFADMAKEKGDMYLFTSSSAALASVPMLGMSKAADLLKDFYSANVIRFEEGKVVVESKAYTNDMLADTLHNYAGPKVDMDLINHYPGTVNGFALFSFNPRIITAIMNIAGVTATANQGMQQLGFGIDDVTRAFKGDFAVVFSNFGMVEKSNPEYPDFTYRQPAARLLFNAAIADKAAYDKIMAALASRGIMVQQNGQYILKEMAEGAADGFVMNADGKNLLVASDTALMQQYKSGNASITLPQGIADRVKGNAVAFYADIAAMLAAMPADTTAGNDAMNSAKQTFKDVVMTSENIEGNTIKGHLELRMLNEKEGSLAALARYFGSVAHSIHFGQNESDMLEDGMTPEEE